MLNFHQMFMWELWDDASTNWTCVLSGDYSHSWYDWNLIIQCHPVHHWPWRVWCGVPSRVGSQLLCLLTTLRYMWCKIWTTIWVSLSTCMTSVPYNAHHCWPHALYAIQIYGLSAISRLVLGMARKNVLHCPVVQSIRTNFHLLTVTTLDFHTQLSCHDELYFWYSCIVFFCSPSLLSP